MELGSAIDQGDPNGFVALRRKALAAQRKLQGPAEVFRIAFQRAQKPRSLAIHDVRLVCEAFLEKVSR